MKRKILLLSVLAICVAILAAGSLAYFTAEDTAHNVITTGSVDITLLEWADEEKQTPFEDLGGIMPGMSITKIAEVKNTGASDAWIRVRIDKTITLTRAGTADAALVELDLNLDDWTQGEDGYLYYKEAVKPGETTAPIFTTVTFNRTMGNEYQNATAKVDIYAQGVQTANNGETVEEAQGWPAEEQE